MADLQLLGNIIDSTNSAASLDTTGAGLASFFVCNNNFGTAFGIGTDLNAGSNFTLRKIIAGTTTDSRIWTDKDFANPNTLWDSWASGVYTTSSQVLLGASSSSDTGQFQIINTSSAIQRIRASNTFGISQILFDTGIGTNRSDTPTSIYQVSGNGLFIYVDGIHISGGLTYKWTAPLNIATHGQLRMRIGDDYDGGKITINNLSGSGDQFVYVNNSGDLINTDMYGFTSLTLIDSMSNTSIDWNNRSLIDSSLITKFNWENMILYGDTNIQGSLLTNNPTGFTAKLTKFGEVGSISGSTQLFLNALGLGNIDLYKVEEVNGQVIYLLGLSTQPV